jgi:segregation and condensation protein B
MRFGLKDVNELPSMEEFEKLVAESFQGELTSVEEAVRSNSNSQERASELTTSAEASAEAVSESAARKE